MSDERPANGQRAALALAAIGLYTEPGTADLPSETDFFLDYQRDALPGGDHDRLAGLLTGLMHYAERRELSFKDALTGARQEYHRQQTTYTPGTAVRRTGPTSRSPDPDDRPMIGEVISARPGHPAQYLVNFITSREWLPEPELTPAPPFPVLTTAYGTFSTAYAAQHVLEHIVRGAEKAHLEDRLWGSDAIIDLDRTLAALSGWSGLRRDTLLRTFGEVISEEDGMLIAGANTSHPVGLAAASTPIPPCDAAPELTTDSDARDAVVSPLRNPGPRTQAGPR